MKQRKYLVELNKENPSFIVCYEMIFYKHVNNAKTHTHKENTSKLSCMEMEMDTRKRNVSKRGNVIFDFFCFGNVLETSINKYIYTHTHIYIYTYVTD